MDLTFLSDDERIAILKVLKRDEHILKHESERIKRLKSEIQRLKQKASLCENSEHICARCHRTLIAILFPGLVCPRCGVKTCRSCRVHNEFSENWLCILCHKQIVLSTISNEWFYKKVKQRYRVKTTSHLHASNFIRASIRRSNYAYYAKSTKEDSSALNLPSKERSVSPNLAPPSPNSVGNCTAPVSPSKSSEPEKQNDVQPPPLQRAPPFRHSSHEGAFNHLPGHPHLATRHSVSPVRQMSTRSLPRPPRMHGSPNARGYLRGVHRLGPAFRSANHIYAHRQLSEESPRFRHLAASFDGDMRSYHRHSVSGASGGDNTHGLILHKVMVLRRFASPNRKMRSPNHNRDNSLESESSGCNGQAPISISGEKDLRKSSTKSHEDNGVDDCADVAPKPMKPTLEGISSKTLPLKSEVLKPSSSQRKSLQRTNAEIEYTSLEINRQSSTRSLSPNSSQHSLDNSGIANGGLSAKCLPRRHHRSASFNTSESDDNPWSDQSIHIANSFVDETIDSARASRELSFSTASSLLHSYASTDDSFTKTKETEPTHIHHENNLAKQALRSISLLNLSSTHASNPFKFKANLSSTSLTSSVDSLYSVSSLDSVLSDSSPIPVTGQIDVNIYYDMDDLELFVFVYCCRGLAIADKKHGSSSPYLKLQLLPDENMVFKRKSPVIYNQLNPVFNYRFSYVMPLSHVRGRMLSLGVWHRHKVRKNFFLGGIDVDLSSWNLEESKTAVHTFRLISECSSHQPAIKRRGEMSCSLLLKPRSRKLTCTIGNLFYIDGKSISRNRSRTLHLKSYLLPLNVSKSGKQKTKPFKVHNESLAINHTFVWAGLTTAQLKQACVEVTLWESLLGRNKFLGGVRFSLGTGSYENEIVEWMQATVEEVDLWSTMLDNPDETASAVLALRRDMLPSNHKSR